MKKQAFLAVALLAVALSAASAAGPGTLNVAVQKTQVRATASYMGSVLGILSYGDTVTVLTQPAGAPKDWVFVQTADRKVQGWVNMAAMTAKKVAVSSSGAAATQAASSGDVALAGKGFNSSVESEFKSEKALDYTWVDWAQAYTVAPETVAAFRDQGGLSTAEVAQ